MRKMFMRTKTSSKIRALTCLSAENTRNTKNEWIQSFPKIILTKTQYKSAIFFFRRYDQFNIFLSFVWGVWYRGCSRYKYAKFWNFKYLLIGSEFRFTVNATDAFEWKNIEYLLLYRVYKQNIFLGVIYREWSITYKFASENISILSMIRCSFFEYNKLNWILNSKSALKFFILLL